MKRLADGIDRLNEAIGRVICWFVILMVLLQLGVVMARYVFGVGHLWAQEALIYMHATVFLLLAGFALKDDIHVRVDLIYREMTERRKAWVNLLGSIGLLLPFCVLIILTSWPYVRQSWAIKEGSIETTGLPLIYLLKTEILIFAILLFLQGIAMAIRAALTLKADVPAESH